MSLLGYVYHNGVHVHIMSLLGYVYHMVYMYIYVTSGICIPYGVHVHIMSLLGYLNNAHVLSVSLPGYLYVHTLCHIWGMRTCTYMSLLVYMYIM